LGAIVEEGHQVLQPVLDVGCLVRHLALHLIGLVQGCDHAGHMVPWLLMLMFGDLYDYILLF